MNSTIKTYTGIYFDPLNPKVEDIHIIDIAHALSNQCRFSGHCNQFYSVAQHSVMVSGLTDSMWGLLHDASEAYLVDLPRPLKHCSEMGSFYKKHEEELMRAICERFGLPVEEPENVKEADRVMLITEQRDLMGSEKPWYPDVKPLNYRVHPRTPVASKNEFMYRYYRLGGKDV